MNNFIFYLIGFFVAVYVARLLGEKAMKHLDTEQKAGLIDLFATDRKYGSALIFCLVIAFLVVLQFRLVKPIIAFSVYFVIMIGYVFFKNYRTYTKLTANHYPAEYIRKILIANILATAGVITFLGLMFFEAFMD
jgi:positive regulator of sigma E activity